MLKLYFCSQYPGWRFLASLLRTGIAFGLSSDGEGYAEVFCGGLAIDCDTSEGRFNLEMAVGYSFWISFGFDGQRFSWGGGI